MRSRDKCMEMMRADDIGISRCTLDRLIRENKIPYFKTGVKVLVNYDKLLEFLNEGTVTGEIEIDDYSGEIRKAKI